MNKLEQAIIDGARAAHADYECFTGGYWLSYGPESFLTYAIARKIYKEGFYAVPECSPKTIWEEQSDPKPRGRPPKNSRQRFDLVVWNQANNGIVAVLEIKKAWNITNLSGDRKKIDEYLKTNDFGKVAGYLLAYNEAEGKRRTDRTDMLKKRFEYWAQKLNCTLLEPHIKAPRNAEWAWGVALLRLNR
ncbi:MAG: hypothetical protein ABSF52_13500 [Syntrophobacteraceae bacterium]|jgi:hypothetical protein